MKLTIRIRRFQAEVISGKMQKNRQDMIGINGSNYLKSQRWRGIKFRCQSLYERLTPKTQELQRWWETWKKSL